MQLAETLEGRIVRLEPLEARHEEPLWEAAQDPEVWRITSSDVGASRDHFDAWWRQLRAAQEAGEEVPFATLDRASGRIVGSTRYLTLRPEHRGLEIGHTWLRSEVWETGANVDAKLLMLEHAFERVGCMRVEFKTDARNERSRGAMAALPARFEGIFRKHMLVQGSVVRDSAYYSIVDDDWPEVRANLQRRLQSK